MNLTPRYLTGLLGVALLAGCQAEVDGNPDSPGSGAAMGAGAVGGSGAGPSTGGTGGGAGAAMTGGTGGVGTGGSVTGGAGGSVATGGTGALPANCQGSDVAAAKRMRAMIKTTKARPKSRQSRQSSESPKSSAKIRNDS